MVVTIIITNCYLLSIIITIITTLNCWINSIVCFHLINFIVINYYYFHLINFIVNFKIFIIITSLIEQLKYYPTYMFVY